MGQASGFSLLSSPFAVLGATPLTPLEEPNDLASRAASPAAAAAARSLSVPRSRLTAELAFLPGSAEAAPAVLAALTAGLRPAPRS